MLFQKKTGQQAGSRRFINSCLDCTFTVILWLKHNSESSSTTQTERRVLLSCDLRLPKHSVTITGPESHPCRTPWSRYASSLLHKYVFPRLVEGSFHTALQCSHNTTTETHAYKIFNRSFIITIAYLYIFILMVIFTSRLHVPIILPISRQSITFTPSPNIL